MEMAYVLQAYQTSLPQAQAVEIWFLTQERRLQFFKNVQRWHLYDPQ